MQVDASKKMSFAEICETRCSSTQENSQAHFWFAGAGVVGGGWKRVGDSEKRQTSACVGHGNIAGKDI